MWKKITKAAEKGVFRGLTKIRPADPVTLPLQPRVIAVFSCTGIGDGLFDSAAIRCLKLGYPDARLVVVAHHRRMTVARHNPFADEVLPYSKSPWTRFRLLGAFRTSRPCLVVALRVNEEAVPLGYLLNRHAFFGSVHRCRSFSFLLSHPIESSPQSHAVEKTLSVARAAGGAPDAPGTMIYQVHETEREAASRRFAPWFGEPYIAWQVGGGRTLGYRDWPPRHIIEAIRLLQGQIPHRIVITGGHDNREAANLIASACPDVINLCRRTSLEETAAVVQSASLLVSSDTGVMHLGFAIGTPTLALLHPRSRPENFGPPAGDPRFEVIHLQPSPEGGAPVGMDDLEPRRVVEAVLRRVRRGVSS